MRYLVELLIGLGCVACGGHSVTTDPQPVSKPDPSGATAGTGSTTGTPNQGGSTPKAEPEPEPDPQPVCDGPTPMCVPNCTSRDRMFADCVGPQYRCGMGWIDLDSCPKDACARASQTCCSPTGQTEFPACAADGSIDECAPGFRSTDVCVPEGLGITDCSELQDGTACTSAELVCRTDLCGLNCYCNPDAAGVLRWQCWVNLC